MMSLELLGLGQAALGGDRVGEGAGPCSRLRAELAGGELGVLLADGGGDVGRA